MKRFPRYDLRKKELMKYKIFEQWQIVHKSELGVDVPDWHIVTHVHKNLLGGMQYTFEPVNLFKFKPLRLLQMWMIKKAFGRPMKEQSIIERIRNLQP